MDDGDLRWISVNARALREDDVITGVVTTFVDVTEQRARSLPRWPSPSGASG